MPTLKHSRQRDAIKEYLAHTTSHPTADTVYLHIKKEFPNISLGTVYRNLHLLVKTGEALKITSADGGDRFDGDTSLHYHFFCSECGKVLDIACNNVDYIPQVVSKDFDGVIESHETTFHGKCGECINKEKTI